MTLQEVEAAVRQLSRDERFALLGSLEQQPDLLELRRAAWVAEIELGLDQLERGQSTRYEGKEGLRQLAEGVMARGRAKYAARQAAAE